MQVILIEHPFQPMTTKDSIVLALGFFDGIHLGHQEVIARARKIARERQIPLALMSLDQHPSVVLEQKDPTEVQYISPLQRKIELLEQQGIDRFYIIQFTKTVANLKPQEFVDQYIVGLQAQVVVAGFDYTYGPRSTANMNLLPMYAQERFEIVTVEKYEDQNGKVSSTAVRQALEKGDMALANHLLGYVYRFNGIVVHGFGRGGAMLGYPTANLQIKSDVLLPARGVYCVRVEYAGDWYLGMASIGFNPTFDDVKALVVEVHLLDFTGDLYDQQLEVEWHHYLRPELAFESVTQLVEQLDQDATATRAYFLTKE